MFKLEKSFELLSSMSPKSTKKLHKTKLSKKSPSKLSLKKNLRKSFVFDKPPELNLDNSVVIIEDSFEEAPNASFTTIKVKEVDLVSLSSESVSDSQESSNENNVKKWLDDNDKAYDFSTITSFKHKTFSDSNSDSDIKYSLNNLSLNDNGDKPKNKSIASINNSLENLNKSPVFTSVKIDIQDKIDVNVGSDVIDDSFEENIESYENILDDLYGTSWREKREEILPQSEKKPARKKIEYNGPLTERKPNNRNNLFERKLKIRDSVVIRLNNLCDSDTDSDDNIKNNILNSEMTRQKNNKKLVKKSPKIINSNSSDSSFGINSSDSDYDLNSSLRTRVQKKLFRNNLKDFSSTPKKILKKPTTEEKKKSEEVPTKKKVKNKKEVEKTKKETAGLKEGEKFSFLYSLSDCLPSWQSDQEARYFRDNYSKQKEKLAQKLFQLYNEKVFKKALPIDTLIEWNPRINKTAGLCYNRRLTKRDGSVHRLCRIVLAPKVLTCAARLRDTLIHEMCHAATWIVNGVTDGHGSQWRAWANKAQIVFPELPPISVCHNYVIQTKYTYKCTGCGYSINRHSKSLDTNRKRCGICFGTFEVIVNKKNGDVREKRVETSKTPKKNPFADFVKENYKDVRKKEVTHAAAMKILAQKFKEMKVDNTPKIDA